MLREARRAYYEYYLVARGQAVNVELKGLLTQFRRIAVGKYSAGTVGLNDALQADVELAMLDHEEVALSRERRGVPAPVYSPPPREARPLPRAPPEPAVPPAPG